MGLYVLKFPYRKILLPLAKKLAFIDPDILSYAATVITVGTGLCYYFALRSPLLLLLAVVLILARMTLNTIDGVIAIEQKKDTLKGEIVNALPDRYSDIFHLAGIALSPLCGGALGIMGISSVFLVSYTGMLGKALGVEWQHHGPLGKVERLILLIVFSVIQYAAIFNGHAHASVLGASFTPLEWCMIIFIALGQITVLNRLQGMLAQINKAEWIKKGKATELRQRVLVVYDSTTGNTRKVAEEIGRSLQAEVAMASAVQHVGDYDCVIIGTPNIRKHPTKGIIAFIDQHKAEIKAYALFVTWGMPVWGPLSTRACLNDVMRAFDRKPIGVFSCRGYHAKYQTYRGRPDDRDLLAAYNFGIRVAKKMGRVR